MRHTWGRSHTRLTLRTAARDSEGGAADEACMRAEPHQAGAAKYRWETIRYALDSTSRTLRLCAILLVVSTPPCLITVLIRR